MNFFIHTLSLSNNITYEQMQTLCHAYKGITSYDDLQKKKFTITEFDKKGFRIILKKRTDKEIRFDSTHRQIQAEMIANPYKLLHNGEALGQISNQKDFIFSTQELFGILNQINEQCFVDLYPGFKIERVDITGDIMTPSNKYTKEIISASKVNQLTYGCQYKNPTDEECLQNGWDPENANLFCNNSQGVYAKIYDKRQNLTDLGHDVSRFSDRGLIRYEISLSRKYLKKQGYLHNDDILYCYDSVMKYASVIMMDFFVRNGSPNDMMSFTLIEKFLWKKLKTKLKRIDNMIVFEKAAEACRKKKLLFCPKTLGISDKAFSTLNKHFEELCLSPSPPLLNVLMFHLSTI